MTWSLFVSSVGFRTDFHEPNLFCCVENVGMKISMVGYLVPIKGGRDFFNLPEGNI